MKKYRYGGNRYEGEVIEDTGLLFPGIAVEKVGRTTGIQNGHVNTYLVQKWQSSVITHEIAIIGAPGNPFAAVGDSGGCVLIKVNGQSYAAGILIGINSSNDFAMVTPLHSILSSLPGYRWAYDESS